MTRSGVWLCATSMVLLTIGCARNTDVVGAPLTEDERRDAYRTVLVALPDTLRLANPVLQPTICLDRGIYATAFGANVEDHDAGWLGDLQSERVVQAVADHSPAGCPEESYWVVLANVALLPGDSVAVPLTVQRILQRTGPRADRVAWRAIVVDDGGWHLVRWQ